MALVSSGAPGFQGSLPTLLTSRSIVEQAPQKRGRQGFACSEIKLPEEIEACPPTLRIRNTFLDTEEQRPPSLEPFFRERSVRTCPGAHAGLLQGLFSESTPSMSGCGGQTPVAPMPSPSPYMPVTPSPAAALGRTVVSLEAMLGLPSAPLAAAAAFPAPVPQEVAAVEALPFYSPPAAPPQLPLSAQQMVPSASPAAPAPGSAELPSIGSALHASGGCKPCAFLYTKGCENGVNCTFCHLCDSEERRRRRKAKVEAQQATRREKLLREASSKGQ